ncbi:DUF6541 family protein [Microbacterium pumilum]|uniref:Uncharacterized protein n=1 Tax=Microbacterium pumilum TaxID=344165 RepID=A0ABN2SDL9_9MICO
MAWIAFSWAALATVLLLGVVGVPLARIIGVRGFASVALAPAFAVTVIGIAAVVAPWAGLPWSIVPVILLTIVLGGVLWGVRRATRRFTPPPVARHRFDGWLLFALLVAAVLLTARVAGVFGDPENISQTFDNIFHLNGVRFVLDTGNASSLWLGHMTNPSGGLAFYPAAWHALVSLTVQLSGVSIPAAINAVTVVVSAVIWPLGALLLTRVLFGRSPVLSVTAGLLAASLPVFPILLMDYGVLYPYQLGLALLPAALAATMRALGLAGGRMAPGRVWWAVALLGCLPGLALAHPGALLGWLALTAPMALVVVVTRLRAARTARARWAVLGVFVAYLAIGVVLLKVLRPPAEARGWPLRMGMVDAVVDVLTVSAWYDVSAVLAAVLVVGGLVWAVVARTPRAIVALGMYVVAAILYIAVAALPLMPLRDILTGGWYNNLPRLAAMLPIALVPLGAYGAACSWACIARHQGVRRLDAKLPRWAAAGLGIIVTVGAAAAMQAPSVSPLPVAQQWAASPFVLGPGSALLTADEAAVISRLDEHVPEGVVVAGSPWTGASLAFALADRPVLMPHTLMEIGDEMQLINDGLADATPGGVVCDAVDELGVGFVLDFAGREVHPGEHVFPGLQDLATSPAVELVDEQGDAKLYELTACER